MTQYSRPWAGTTIGDAGPYTAANWWDVWQSFMKASGAKTAVGNFGVFYVVPSRLVATSPAGNTVSIDVGAALVDGLYYENTAAVTFTVPNATAGNIRDDRIVLRKTFSAATQTCRLLLLVGSEAAAPGPGIPPAITQDATRATFYDILLWRVSVTDAGVITLTDERTWVDVAIKYVSLPALAGYNTTDASDILATYNSSGPALAFPDGKDCYATGIIVAPLDLADDVMYISALVLSPDSANAALDVACRATVDEYAANNPAAVQSEVTGALVETYNYHDRYQLLAEIDIANVVPGNILNPVFFRDGSLAGDTLSGTLLMHAFRLKYLGYK